MNNEFCNIYNSLFYKIKDRDNLYYIVISPKSGLKSLEQLKFLVKKSIRDICKKYNIKKTYNFVNFLMNIEVNSVITKKIDLTDYKIKDMGFHAHLVIDLTIDIFRSIDFNNLLEQIEETFLKNRIVIDVKGYDNIYYKDGLRNYHLKQADYLNPTFISSNIKLKDLKTIII